MGVSNVLFRVFTDCGIADDNQVEIDVKPAARVA